MDKPASPACPDIPATSHTTSPALASSPTPKKASSPVKDDPPPEQDNSASDVHMDSGAQQDTPDTGANTSGAGTAEDASASDKSADIEKGKAPKVPEDRTNPVPTSPGQATPAAPDQPTPKAPTPEKTIVPVKTSTFKMKQIIKTAPPSATTAPAPAKPAPSSSAMTLHIGKGAARPSFFHTPELEGRVSLWTKSDKSLGSLKEYCMKWNDADYMDTASSKKKKLTGVLAPGNPDVVPAKPIAIASELFSIQQRLHILADATNVSIFLIYPQSPKMLAVRDTNIQDFPILFST
jgi:hypothetical protein